MGTITEYLQDSFAEFCPPGWTCRREVPVLDGALAELFGYAPKADVLLERNDGERKLWIEFEVSRADPVANHAKFATAHIFQPQRPIETFVSMVSWHVARGRRNLGANTISLMRHIGMNAFQTTLLPNISPADIPRLNHLDKRALVELNLEPQREIARAMLVSEALETTDRYRVFFVGDLLDVIFNLQQWNRELLTDSSRRLWGRRRVRYFVFDPKTGGFAPSKFCAYRPIPQIGTNVLPVTASTMTMELYTSLNEDDPRFDGNRAWRHLHDNLGMSLRPMTDHPDIAAKFQTWLSGVADAVQLDSRGPLVLCPPEWFR